MRSIVQDFFLWYYYYECVRNNFNKLSLHNENQSATIVTGQTALCKEHINYSAFPRIRKQQIQRKAIILRSSYYLVRFHILESDSEK